MAADSCMDSAIRYLRETKASLFKQQGYATCGGLRSLAMLWVMAHHVVATFLTTGGAKDARAELIRWWEPVAVPMNGDVGVDLFLVLSGFLLGGSLFREFAASGTFHYGKFYLRRWFRIAPALMSAVLLTMIFNVDVGRQTCLSEGWTNFLFVNNYYPRWHAFADLCAKHTWSIAVEFQLYFISPPIFALAHCISRSVPKFSFATCAIALCALMWMMCCTLRLVYTFMRSEIGQADQFSLPDVPYTDTLCRMAPYFAGSIGGILMQQPKDSPHPFVPNVFLRVSRAIWTSLAVLVLLVAFMFGGSDSKIYCNSHKESCAALTVLFMLLGALLRPFLGAAMAYLLVRSVSDEANCFSWFLSAPIWTPLAGLSYSMYLLQYLGWLLLFRPILNLAGPHLASLSLISAWSLSIAFCLLAVLGTLPLALVNYALVERPGMLLGKKLLERLENCELASCTRKADNKEPVPDNRKDTPSTLTEDDNPPSQTAEQQV